MTIAEPVELDITIPDTQAGFEEMMADKAKMKDLYLDLAQGGEKFESWVAGYAKNVLKRDQDIATQVRDETQKVLANFLREQADEGFTPVSPVTLPTGNERGAGVDPNVRMNAKAGLFNSRAMGAELDEMFSGVHGMADCLQLIWHDYKRQANAASQGKLKKMRNAFQGDVPSDGGFLIPENLRSEVLRVSLETAIVRPRARIIPMETLTVPFPAIDATTNVGSVYGGITTAWAEAGSDLSSSESSPKFRRLVLHARKLIAFTKVEQELIADSVISFLPFINELFPEAIGFEEDYAFLNGNGAGQPLGMLKTDNPAMIAVAKESGQAASTILWENIVKMYARMLPQSLSRAVWIVTPDAFPELATMALSVGTGGSAVWLNNGVSGPPATVLGRPSLRARRIATPSSFSTAGS